MLKSCYLIFYISLYLLKKLKQCAYQTPRFGIKAQNKPQPIALSEIIFKNLCVISNSEVIIRSIAYNNNQGSEVFGQRSMSWEQFKITAAMRYYFQFSALKRFKYTLKVSLGSVCSRNRPLKTPTWQPVSIALC